MSKYDALTDILNRSGSGEYLMDQLNEVIPGGLPRSAYDWEAWWNNDDPSHHHCQSWAAAGLVARPDLGRKLVRFESLPKHRSTGP